MSFRDPLTAALGRIAALEDELRQLRESPSPSEELFAIQERLYDAEAKAAEARAELEAQIAMAEADREMRQAELEMERTVHREEQDAEQRVHEAEIEQLMVSVRELELQLEWRDRTIASLETDIELLASLPDRGLAHFSKLADALTAQLAELEDDATDGGTIKRDLTRERLDRVQRILEALRRSGA